MPKIYAKDQYLIIGDDYFIPDYRVIKSEKNGTLRLESTSNQPVFKFVLADLSDEIGNVFSSINSAMEYLTPIVYRLDQEDNNTAFLAGNGQLQTDFQLSTITTLNEINETLKDMLFYIKGISE